KKSHAASVSIDESKNALLLEILFDENEIIKTGTWIAHLEAWAVLDRDHSSSLLGATEALKASTLRLPIVGKAIVDIQNLKDAVGSAVDVMHAMASSICSLSSKVKEMNSLVNELVSVAANERILLEQCKEHLSTLAAIQ
ncbi:hypothetical protein Goari_024627, partial [Gossypium aridum]|nr:hypothetical protein [Gossypium aridum]